jgi:hypothetical protein
MSRAPRGRDRKDVRTVAPAVGRLCGAAAHPRSAGADLRVFCSTPRGGRRRAGDGATALPGGLPDEAGLGLIPDGQEGDFNPRSIVRG